MVDETEQEICLCINDALYNAGLLGLKRVLDCLAERQDEAPAYRTEGSRLYVRKDAFTDELVPAYFDAMIQHYGKDTVYQNLVDTLENILQPAAQEQKDFPKKLKDCTKLLADKFKRNSYLAGFEILSQNNSVTFDFLGAAKAAKNETEPQKQLALLREILQQMKGENVRRVLLLKDIVYTRVQNYWSGVSFLHKTHNKDPFEKAFTEYFIRAIEAYKPKKGKKAMDCFQCGCTLQAGASSTAWVNQTMPDIKRKTDSFWNFTPDILLCPYCMLVYACVPLGFTTFAGEGVFVNDCRSLRTLESANVFQDISEELQNDTFAVVINRFTLNAEEKKAKNALQNVQVVRCSGSNYHVNTLTVDMLQAFLKLKPTFASLLKANPHLFHRTLEKVLNGQELYGMLLHDYREALNGGYGLGIYPFILKIQIAMFYRKKEDALTTAEKARANAYDAGRALRVRVRAVNPDNGKTKANEKRLVGVTYRLLNALQSNDYRLFMDTVDRQYISLGMDIPRVLLDAVCDDEMLALVGHSFVQGLNSNVTKGSNSKDENVKAESEEK